MTQTPAQRPEAADAAAPAPAAAPASREAAPAPRAAEAARPAAGAMTVTPPAPAPAVTPQAAAAARQAKPLLAVPVPAPARPPAKPPAPPPAPPRAGGAPMPAVGIARPRYRHWALLASFVLCVVLPSLLAAGYLWTRAANQYVSTVAFSVRQTDQSSGLDLLGGLSAFTNTAATSDTDILYEYFRSPDMVTRLQERMDLPAMFSKAWPRDFWYAYDPDGTLEDLVEHWNRQVRVMNDDNTAIITVKVAAYAPEDARSIAQGIFDEGSRFINQLSDVAREDSTRYAREEVAKAEARVRDVRQEFVEFRTRTQIVDPAADFSAAMGVLAQLQAQLADAMVAQDLLRESGTREGDPRMEQAGRRIAAIENRIVQEREKFSADSAGPNGESYAKLVTEYERLMADRGFAEGAYTASRAALDIALAEAERQTRYLAAHIAPQLAQQSTRPDRPLVLGFFAGFALLIWAVGILIYYSIRDRG